MRREEEEVKTFVGKELATSFIQLMANAFFMVFVDGLLTSAFSNKESSTFHVHNPGASCCK